VLPVIAFAGIGRPEKAFATIRNSGARVIATHAFGDHHRYTEREAQRLLDEAEAKKAMLVTTAKDWVRLPDAGGTARGELKHRSRPLPIALKFDDEAAVRALLATDQAKPRA
jgi:tetraacyldisaccharide 4'-kinase